MNLIRVKEVKELPEFKGFKITEFKKGDYGIQGILIEDQVGQVLSINVSGAYDQMSVYIKEPKKKVTYWVLTGKFMGLEFEMKFLDEREADKKGEEFKDMCRDKFGSQNYDIKKSQIEIEE
jgi:hypothetical protein